MDFLALVIIHIPDKYSNRVLYYGHYSKKSRGFRKKKLEEQEQDSSGPPYGIDQGAGRNPR